MKGYSVSKQVRYGFIGAGAIGQFAAKQVNECERSQVVAAYDTSAERLAALCKEFNIARAATSAEAVFEGDDVDAVYIAVPNRFHAAYAVAALRAGKHVILDKPFAMNSAEAEQVADAAEASGKLFALGMNQRFVPDCQKIKTLVQRGIFGDLYHAKAHWFRRTGIPRMGTWFGNKQLAGGGCLLDIGVHLLDLALYTIDNFDAVAVSGATYTKFGSRGLGEGGWGKSDREKIPFDVDDFASALIKFRNGATVTLDVSWACHAEQPNRMNVEIYGENAGASLYPAKVFRAGDISDYDVVTDVKADLAYPHADRFANFTRAVLGEEELCCTIEQALAVQRILDAIYQSAATGREVAIGEPVTV